MISISMAMLAAAAINPQPHNYPNGWYAGEQGNLCIARFDQPDGTSLTISNTRWDDLSDHLLFWTPGLKPLWSEPDEGLDSGMTPEEEQAEADVGYHLEFRLDGRKGKPLLHHRMLTNYMDRPGATYVIAINQKSFLKSLGRAKVIEIVRNGKILGRFKIAPATEMTNMLKSCVDKPIL